ncbi:preprotein translocase subunit SecA [Cohnella cholangitidis]|uniref:Protein translocase subunit SecA n=1 Tax=Cohnella cholangitidis TaxID=2598458 RepID=A0A7G5C623_9BACL|nr:accessory Sec system translocase SecA2 [Cohnella cholangitidis]QMV44657.1 accessory Sec system translocase SecA2 [Cohnella cholangitidis]
MNFASKLVQKVKERFVQHHLKSYTDKLREIQALKLESWDDDRLQAESLKLKNKAQSGVPLDDLLVEAFAIAGETASRVLGMRPFDVQYTAGTALHERNLVEMQTGEGKTLSAVMPAYLNALQGKGVHILTFNDYLAGRDAEWMGPVYRFLGLTVGFVKDGMTTEERQRAYAADITYVTAKQAGFDYLRDTISMKPDAIVHRPFHFAIVDEADSLLIDEARVPLVIAGEVATTGGDGSRMAKLARELQLGEDYDFDENKRNVFLTETGAEKAEQLLRSGNLYEAHNSHLLTALNCALHAEALLKKDVDYMIRDGKLELIDLHTGRVAENRHWPDGLQAAVEAKEGMVSNSSGKILGTITLQHFLSLYPKFSGMTATAQDSADEFDETYSLRVVQIPPNRPRIRIDHESRIFTHKEAKLKALVKEIVDVHATKRPILIGTSSVEESDHLAELLKKSGVPCHVLNAKNDEKEAEIISKAGELGAVTVSTNMAGRGVDIRLGGGDPIQAEQVAELGGLYVIGTHMNESARIDNQLRGRAGRQGDPGSSRFYVCLEDELISRFGIEKAIPEAYRTKRQDEPLEASVFHKKTDHIQRVVMGQNFETRKTLNKYSDMLEEQRRIHQEQRDEVLYNDDTLSATEKYVRLHHMDRAWSDHLAYVSYIREGIHLESLANRNPVDEFHHRIIHAFEQLPDKIEKETAKSLSKLNAKGAQDEIDWEKEGLKGPSRTWTYLIQDQFIEKKANIFGL